MIASVLAQKYNVLKTEGNLNNEIGLPLTIFKIREEHQVAVLEMGISEFGEMDRLSTMANPRRFCCRKRWIWSLYPARLLMQTASGSAWARAITTGIFPAAKTR